MAIYTEGIMADGACIMKDGVKMTISEILSSFNRADGNVRCDACGNWIELDEPNLGVDCNLHERCV